MSAHRRSPSASGSRYHPFTTVRRLLGRFASTSPLPVNDETDCSDSTNVIETHPSEDTNSSHTGTANFEAEKGDVGSEDDRENEGKGGDKSTECGKGDNLAEGDGNRSEEGEGTLGSNGSGELEKELGFESSSEPEVIEPAAYPHSTQGNPLGQQSLGQPSVIFIDDKSNSHHLDARDDGNDQGEGGAQDTSNGDTTAERAASASRSSRSAPLSSLGMPTGKAVAERVVLLPPFEHLSALSHAEYDPHTVASEKCNRWLANPPPELEEGEILEVVELTTTTNSFSDAPTELVFGSAARGVAGYDFSSKSFMGGRMQYSPPLPGPPSQNRWVFLPDHTFSTAALVRSIGDIDFTPKPLGGPGFTYFVFSELESEPLEYCWSLAKIGDPHPVLVKYRLTHAPNCAPVWTYQG